MQPLVGTAFEPLLASLTTHAPEATPWPSPIRIGVVPDKGRGIFATRNIAQGELVECAPVVIVPPEQTERICGTVLEFYVFDWYEDASAFAVALGTASLYNHSFLPNVRYEKRYAEGLIEFRAIRNILAGEELVSNYNGDPNDRSPVWFPTVDEGDAA